MTNTQDTTSMKAASVSSTKNLTKHEHTMTNSKMIYAFEEGNKDMKTLLGGKGANLAEMTNLGLPVPPGFTITTDMCNYYLENNSLPETFDAMLNERIA